MCRLLGYVTRAPLSVRSLLGAGFESFMELSCGAHGDGWGMAWLDAKELRLEKEPVAAHSSSRFESLSSTKTSDAGLVHLRWATLDLGVNLENTHPFSSEGVAFAHNGSVSPPQGLEAYSSQEQISQLEGTTDSERLFRAVMSSARELGMKQSLATTTVSIANEMSFTSLNSMALTPEFLHVVCLYAPDTITGDLEPDYYTMRYLASEDAIVVASSGWDQDGWTELGNGKMLSINRVTLEYSVEEIMDLEKV